MAHNDAPLAFRVRPQQLADFIGQEHVVGEGTALRKAIENDTLQSVLLSGPPGTGKTTLAHVIANATKAEFVQVNAVLSGAKELKAICAEAERVRSSLGQKTVLFIDEIHRFNTAQQDALLPYVESGAVILIGATTENPYFSVNAALVSRSQVYMLQPLSEDHLVTILRNAVDDPRGLGGKVTIANNVLEHMANRANGDARIALNMLELAVLTHGAKVTMEQAQALLREKSKRYDSDREEHYNVISAFIKSMRGSDPDAAMVWLYRMIQGGEDPNFLFRRMAIFASEDIGNADPRALHVVVSAWDACEKVGLPEAEYFLAHACIYLAQAPKSNAVTRAMGAVKKFLNSAKSLEVPFHLRNVPVKGMAQQGYGKGYHYPHSDERGVVQGHYFPIGVDPVNFYEPTDRGFEDEVSKRMQQVRGIVRATPRRSQSC